LAVEEDGWIGEFFPREAEGGAKEDLGRPAPGQGHEAHAFLEVAVAGEEFESGLDEGFRDPSGMRLDWSWWMRSWGSGVPARGFLPVRARAR
jgi:hypothetical protein